MTCVVQTQRDVVAARGADEQIRGGKAVAVVWVRGRGLAVAITANDIRYKHVTRQFEVTTIDDLRGKSRRKMICTRGEVKSPSYGAGFAFPLSSVRPLNATRAC